MVRGWTCKRLLQAWCNLNDYSQYCIIVVTHSKHDAMIDEFLGPMPPDKAMRRLISILEKHGVEEAEDIVAMGDLDDFRYEDVGWFVETREISATAAYGKRWK